MCGGKCYLETQMAEEEQKNTIDKKLAKDKIIVLFLEKNKNFFPNLFLDKRQQLNTTLDILSPSDYLFRLLRPPKC